MRRLAPLLSRELLTKKLQRTVTYDGPRPVPRRLGTPVSCTAAQPAILFVLSTVASLQSPGASAIAALALSAAIPSFREQAQLETKSIT